MKILNIGGLIATFPIIQGGMGIGVSLSRLSSAVANEGGIGVISTVAIQKVVLTHESSNYRKDSIKALTQEIRKSRKLSKGIIGVNIMVALSNFADMVRVSIAEKIDIIFSGAGLPLDLPKYLIGQDSKTKLVPIVSSGRAVKIIIKKWKEKFNYIPDAIVVEGPLAGGHLGFKKENIEKEEYQLEKLVPEIKHAVEPFEKEYNVKIPVIAGGGIYTGEDIDKIMQLGADGVQMGTRFVTTVECDASDEFKQAYLDAGKDDVVIIESPVGMPGRALRNKFVEESKNGLTKPKGCPYHCIVTCDPKESLYCIADALVNAQNDMLESGLAFAGSNVYRNDRIITVHELFTTLEKEYEESVRQRTIQNDSLLPIDV